MKILITGLILAFIVSVSTVTYSQDLGEKNVEYKIDKVSIDTYNTETKEWSDNGWSNTSEGSIITFYNKAIVLIGGSNGSVSIYYMDVFKKAKDIYTGSWYVFEDTNKYAKITLTRDPNGKDQIIINFLNGQVVYLSVTVKK